MTEFCVKTFTGNHNSLNALLLAKIKNAFFLLYIFWYHIILCIFNQWVEGQILLDATFVLFISFYFIQLKGFPFTFYFNEFIFAVTAKEIKMFFFPVSFRDFLVSVLLYLETSWATSKIRKMLLRFDCNHHWDEQRRAHRNNFRDILNLTEKQCSVLRTSRNRLVWCDTLTLSFKKKKEKWEIKIKNMLAVMLEAIRVESPVFRNPT